jgi:hypothetical protein
VSLGFLVSSQCLGYPPLHGPLSYIRQFLFSFHFCVIFSDRNLHNINPSLFSQCSIFEGQSITWEWRIILPLSSESSPLSNPSTPLIPFSNFFISLLLIMSCCYFDRFRSVISVYIKSIHKKWADPVGDRVGSLLGCPFLFFPFLL